MFQWFFDIHPWSTEDVDDERLTRMRCYGLPCYSWNTKYFEFFASLVGAFVYLKEETRNHKRLDFSRFLIRKKSSMVLNESVNVEINEHIYGLKLVEDMHGLKRIFVPKTNKKSIMVVDS